MRWTRFALIAAVHLWFTGGLFCCAVGAIGDTTAHRVVSVVKPIMLFPDYVLSEVWRPPGDMGLIARVVVNSLCWAAIVYPVWYAAYRGGRWLRATGRPPRNVQPPT
jgi:hypothetical protein